ncbi:hypothetical protein AMAG_15446 [Allomyces macrogynus ATCC 38327]|uniref:Uncharacterized protein n=1 Tax=Allomyces macrogynus (strain ATCC 38327) TaxID=578462 RepID=A0A0L0T803_ALLM3|nr:hypothetical protein AMAG_15446 [Allomyces macrogynus ATCC 38327]|eukprot:KNE70689.1 hypothetical protein AMAG_15446 [Allomyces macrogynus ATCC 38327]
MTSPPPPPHCPVNARAVRVLVCQETPTKARVPLLDSHVADHTAPNHPHHAKRRLTSPALDLLAPMMFGAMPLSHKGKSFKLHPIRLAGASSTTSSSSSTAAAPLATTPPNTSSSIAPGTATSTHAVDAHAADALLFTCLFAVSLHDIESYLLHATQANGNDPRTSVQTWHAAPAPTSTPRPPVAVTAALSRDVLSTSLTHSTTVPPAHTRSLSSASTSTTSSASDASDPPANARLMTTLPSRTPTSTSAPTPSAAAAAAAALDQRKLAARRLARSTYAVAVVVPAECPAVRDFMIRHFTVWESLLDELQALVGAAIRECFSEAVRTASAEQDGAIPALDSTRLPAGSSAPSPATSTTTTTPIPMPRNGSNGTSNNSSGRASPVPSALARSSTVGSLPGASAAAAAAAATAAAAAAATTPSSPKPPLRRLFSMGLPMPTSSSPASSTVPRDAVSRILPGTSPLASSPVGTSSLLRRPPSTVSLASSTASTPASPVLSASPQSPLLGRASTRTSYKIGSLRRPAGRTATHGRVPRDPTDSTTAGATSAATNSPSAHAASDTGESPVEYGFEHDRPAKPDAVIHLVVVLTPTFVELDVVRVVVDRRGVRAGEPNDPHNAKAYVGRLEEYKGKTLTGPMHLEPEVPAAAEEKKDVVEEAKVEA